MDKKRTPKSKDDYIKAVKAAKSAINLARKNHEKKLINCGDKGSFYKFVRSHSKVRGAVGPVRINGTLTDSVKEIAEHANEYLASVFVKYDIRPTGETKVTEVQQLNDVAISRSITDRFLRIIKERTAAVRLHERYYQ